MNPAPEIRELGPLEKAVLEALWTINEGSVNDVAPRLNRPLAYTTVMTTLDRLFKKGILVRRLVERAYIYSPRYSQSEWELRRAGHLVTGFLSGSKPERDMLISCFVDRVGGYDEALLDDLERKIQEKRQELKRREK